MVDSSLFSRTVLTLCALLIAWTAFSDTNVYATARATSYSGIPDTCHLLGTTFEGNTGLDDVHINITSGGTYWVGASLKMRRNINPIGSSIKDCISNGIDKSLDECNKECEGAHYVIHGESYCSCKNKRPANLQSISSVKTCNKGGKVLCLHGCVVYERVFVERDFLCGTYEYDDYREGQWYFNTTKCSEKKQYIFKCINGDIVNKMVHFSWYEAYQTCKDKGSSLVEEFRDIVGQKTVGRIFWVSFPGQTEIAWGRGFNKDVCIAVNVLPNKTLTFVSMFCSQKLPAICQTMENSGQSFNKANAWLPSAVLLPILLILSAVVYFNRRKKTINSRQNQGRQETDLKNVIGEPVSCNFAYSFAQPDSEPLKNEFLQIKIDGLNDDTNDSCMEPMTDDPTYEIYNRK